MQRIKIPVAAPKIGDKELQYVTECVKSSWISSLGWYVKEFEKRFSSYCGAKYGVATSSGTTALHLALASLGIGRGDEVVIPSLTMIATANAVTYTGAKIALVDSEEECWNIDANKIEEEITEKTKAIIPVHTYGHPADMDPILEVAEKHGLFVVEDAAEAHGAEYKGRKAGGIGDDGCFSFYANKIITTGEGGMLVTNHEDLAERAKALRAHAFSEDKHFWHRAIGFNYRMSSLQAAVGVAQLEKIEEFVERRRKNAMLYNSYLEEIDGVVIPPEANWAKNVYWMYSILIKDEFGMGRDGLMGVLEKDGIETRTFFYPVNIQPIYKDRFDGQRFPVAEALSKTGMNLPSGTTLNEGEIEYVSRRIASASRKGQN